MLRLVGGLSGYLAVALIDLGSLKKREKIFCIVRGHTNCISCLQWAPVSAEPSRRAMTRPVVVGVQESTPGTGVLLSGDSGGLVMKTRMLIPSGAYESFTAIGLSSLVRAVQLLPQSQFLCVKDQKPVLLHSAAPHGIVQLDLKQLPVSLLQTEATSADTQVLQLDWSIATLTDCCKEGGWGSAPAEKAAARQVLLVSSTAGCTVVDMADSQATAVHNNKVLGSIVKCLGVRR